MIIVKCPWKACAYNSLKGNQTYEKIGFCHNKLGVITLDYHQIEVNGEENDFLTCNSFRWKPEPDNIDDYCE